GQSFLATVRVGCQPNQDPLNPVGLWIDDPVLGDKVPFAAAVLLIHMAFEANHLARGGGFAVKNDLALDRAPLGLVGGLDRTVACQKHGQPGHGGQDGDDRNVAHYLFPPSGAGRGMVRTTGKSATLRKLSNRSRMAVACSREEPANNSWLSILSAG